MVCERFTGSGRLQENGFLGTHKQDFEAHRKGCDWRHDADHIDMSPIIPGFPGVDVQETLELIAASLGGSTQGLESVLSVNNNAGAEQIVMNNQFIRELRNPVQPQDAATKWYVDQQLGLNLDQVLTNGNDGGAQLIRNILDPILNQDAATKFYVDSQIGSVTPGGENLNETLTIGAETGNVTIESTGSNNFVTKTDVGTLTMTSGENANPFVIRAGFDSGDAGDLTLQGGTSSSGDGGDTYVLGGSAVSGTSGRVFIQTTTPSVGGNDSGYIFIGSGASSAGGTSGDVTLESSGSSDGNTGDVFIRSGSGSNNPGDTTGNVFVQAGSGSYGVGDVDISAGSSSNNVGGNVGISAGSSSGGGGNIDINAGSGQGQGAFIDLGGAVGGNGGEAIIAAGSHSGGVGGDLYLRAGNGPGAGTFGSVRIQAGSPGGFIILDNDLGSTNIGDFREQGQGGQLRLVNSGEEYETYYGYRNF